MSNSSTLLPCRPQELLFLDDLGRMLIYFSPTCIAYSLGTSFSDGLKNYLAGLKNGWSTVLTRIDPITGQQTSDADGLDFGSCFLELKKDNFPTFESALNRVKQWVSSEIQFYKDDAKDFLLQEIECELSKCHNNYCNAQGIKVTILEERCAFVKFL